MECKEWQGMDQDERTLLSKVKLILFACLVPKSRLKTDWMEKATDKLLCSKNHPSSSKGISQRSVLQTMGLFTQALKLHVACLKLVGKSS